MILTVLAAVTVLQAKTTDPVEAFSPLVKDSKVEVTRDGGFIRFSVSHVEQISSGGQAAQSPLVASQAEVTPVTYTEQFVAVPEGAMVTASQLGWLPPQTGFDVMTADLGLALGYRWFGHATFDVLRAVSQGLHSTDGDSLTSLAIRGLKLYDYRNAAAATDYLRSHEQAAIIPLRDAAPTNRNAIAVLAQMRSPKAIDTLINLHTQPRFQRAIENSFAYGQPVREAKPIYVGGISNPDVSAYCARAAIQFGWTDLQPEIKAAYNTTASIFPKLELLDILHRFKTGKSLPSFDKVHQYFTNWSAHDDRAILASREKIYAPLCVVKMISIQTKAGCPYAKQGVHLADLLIASGRGKQLTETLQRFRVTDQLALARKQSL